MTGFSYDIRLYGDTHAELVLNGYMDENTALPDPETFKKFDLLVINFRMVRSILSIGIKHWIKFVDLLENYEFLKIEYKDCSKQTIDQINLVKGFLPNNATVTSIFVPVHCERCNRSFKVLKNIKNIRQEIDHIVKGMQDIECESFPECKMDMEVEVSPESYLKFLER